MAITAYRAHADARLGLSTDGRTRVVPWVVHGTSDADEALEALVDASPPSEGGLVRSNIGELRMLGSSSWESDISYTPFVGGLPDPSVSGIEGSDASFQFETGGGRRTVRKNLAVPVTKVKTGEAALDGDLIRLINATPEAGVEGVEIDSSVFNFSITRSFSIGELPSSYAATLYRLTNCRNSSMVTLAARGLSLTFEAGDLLFKGGSGSISDSDGRWRFTYNFAASPAEVISLDGFASFYVEGWDYLEIRSVGKPIGSGDTIIQIREPYAAIVHVVYDSADLNQLGV